MIPIINSSAEMSKLSAKIRSEDKTIALVPTMGALHAGHLSLVEEARKKADFVIVSIFVNPTQFAPNEDLDEYPRTLEQDEKALRELGGVDCIFHPSSEEIYDPNHAIWIEASGLDNELCGEFRPGHFRGVCTVVYKLFKICDPHIAVFGKKDAQQFVIIQALSRDLLMDIEIVGAETIRENDGLALSSRNRYLSIESVDDAKIQYLKIVDSTTLQSVESLESGSKILLAAAVYFGQTRLIDNAFIDVP